MAALRDIQNKIAGVKKTRQITRAMNMVAAAKLRGVQETTQRFRPYADKFSEVLASLSSGVDPETHPLLAVPEQVDRVAVIALSADRGLCGSFNTNLINQSKSFIEEQKEQGREVALYTVGRKATEFFSKHGYDIAESMVGAMNVIDFDLAVSVAHLGLNAFLSGEVQEVHLVYSRFINMVKQEPTVERLLPIQPEIEEQDEAEDQKASETAVEYLTEPSAEEILVDLLPRYVNVRVYSALLNTATSEHAARMTAMDNATNACKDFIEELTLAFNKARQAAITAELMDIVGGAEALRG